MESLKSLCFVFSAIVLLASVSCQPNRHIQSRIIGGYGVAPYQFTYQVSIQEIQHSQHICSGAVLSDRWIVTAARCVQAPPEKLQIFYGARSLIERGRISKVAQIFKHPDFDKTYLDNDLAMVLTASRIRFETNVVGPIPLPSQASIENDIAMVSGWGVTHVKCVENEHLSDSLQFESTTVMSLKSCEKQSKDQYAFVHPTSLCTKNRIGSGICSGDLGSPLVSKTKNKALIGVASSYNGCAEGNPDVYTAIYPHLRWIQLLLSSTERQ